MRAESASETIGERNRFIESSLSLAWPAHPEAPDGTVVWPEHQLLFGSMIEQSVDAGTVPPYEVACVELDSRLEAAGHRHVTHIETRDPDGGRTRWSREQVLSAIRDGERFVLVNAGNGTTTLMEPRLCPRCPFFTLVVDTPEATPPRC